MTTVEILKTLCGTAGVSGEELPASRTAEKLLREFTDDVKIDESGNVTAYLAAAEPDAPHILLDAHVDQIGMVVTRVDSNGFVQVESCGGMDRRLVLGQQVTVWGRKPLIGLVAVKPPHLAEKEQSSLPEISEIVIDTGLSGGKAAELIRPGDRVSMTGPMMVLQNGRVTSASLDDRSGIASLIHAVKLLAGKKLPYSVTVLCSTQEETGGPGAGTAAFRAHPDEAIAVDVSFAKQEGVEDLYPRLGEGAMIGIAPVLNRGMFDELLALAEEQKIPYTIEAMGGSTGTNSDKIAGAGSGVKTALISIPLRYMHTPVETIQVSDVEAVGRLIAAYILRDAEKGEN